MRSIFVFFASLFFSFGVGVIWGVIPLPPSIQGEFVFLIPIGFFILGLTSLILGHRFRSENERDDVDSGRQRRPTRFGR